MFQLFKYLQLYTTKLKSWLLPCILIIVIIISFVNIDLNQIEQATPNINHQQVVVNTGKFQVIYSPLQRESSISIQNRFKQDKSFETVAEVLSKMFIMPRDINIIMGDCGFVNAYYKPSNHSIYMCYEIMESFIDRFVKYYKSNGLDINQHPISEEIAQRVSGTMIFTFFHELGHLLIGELDLPVIGKEEDAVDEFATLLLAKLGQDKTLLAAALQFAVAGNREMNVINQNLHFWEEHSLSMQRFYSLVCFVYGKEKQRYAALVEDLSIPNMRKRKCEIEYQRKLKSWHTLLEPYLQNDMKFL